MVVISITVTQSADQIVSGIPKTVSISTNVPATIFYTLDNTTPTLFSSIYTNTIFLPYSQLSITLKILATNGIDYSPILTNIYTTDMVDGNARLPHSATTAQAGSVIPDAYPFGTPPYQPQQGYLNPAQSGVTVFDPSLPSTSTGFDSNGNKTGFTNQPFNIENYQIEYSTTDAIGQTGIGIGTLPAKSTIKQPIPEPETSQQFTATFDPRAYVVFQDFSKEDPNDPPQINRQFFTLENPETARDGNYFFNSGLDSAPISGSFVRAHYNPRTNEMTHYYRDSWTNKWIISTAPFQPNGSYDGNLSGISPGRGSTGGKYVFEWLPFTRRVLF